MAKLPVITSLISNDLRRFLDRVREAFDGNDPVIKRSDLLNSGAFTAGPGGDLDFRGPADSTCGTPPALTNLDASGAMTSILLSWEGWRYPCKAYVEIHRADVDDIGLAVLIGSSTGGLYSDAVGSNATHYYWVRAVNTEGTVGPFNQTAGTKGETAPDILYLLDMLSGQLRESELNQTLTSRIDLIDGDPRTPGTIPYQIEDSKTSAIAAAADDAETAISAAITSYDTAVVGAYRTSIAKSIKDGDAGVTAKVTNLSYSIYGNPLSEDPDAFAGSLALLKTDIEQTASATYATAKDQNSLIAAIYGPEYDISNPLTLDQLTSGSIYEEREVRSSQFETLSQSIEVLTVGAGEGIDAIHTWFYDDGLDNWKPRSTTLSNYFGYLRVESVDTSVPASAYVYTNNAANGDAMSFSGATYNHIRIRGRRTAGDSTSWDFRIFYQIDGIWRVGYTDIERDISVGEYFVINADMSNQAGWTGGTITGLQLRMFKTRKDLFDIDYVTVGRIGVAASTATVLTEREARISGDAVQATNLQTLEAKFQGANAWITSFDEAYSNGEADSADQFSATKSLKTLESEVANARAWIASYDDTFSDANTSAATSLDSLGSELDVTSAWINKLDDTFVSTTGATSYSLNQISTTLGDNSAAIETHAESIDGLKAEYTVKIDNNGHVSGFGLASTRTLGDEAIPGPALSEFSIVADKFSIAPVGTDWADKDSTSPFFYLTKPTVIGGEEIPAGAYMKSAYIHDAAITNAKIGDAAIDDAKISSLSAAKITFGEMDGDRIKANTLDADRIDTDTIVAYLAKITNAYIDSANINKGEIKRANIEDAAINNAKIANLAVDAAKIANATITGAKIKDAQIDTLQLAGQAVTIPSSAFTAGARELYLGNDNKPLLQTLKLTSTGAPIVFNFSACMRILTDPNSLKYGGYNMYAQLYKGDTLIFNGFFWRLIKFNSYVAGTSTSSFSFQALYTPGAGTHTFYLKCWHTKGSGTTNALYTFTNRALTALEVKR